MMKVYDDGETHAEIQAYNLSQSQTPSDFTAFIYEGNIEDDYMTIMKPGKTIDNADAESLYGFGIDDLSLVDNSEDWFSRLQYYFE